MSGNDVSGNDYDIINDSFPPSLWFPLYNLLYSSMYIHVHEKGCFRCRCVVLYCLVLIMYSSTLAPICIYIHLCVLVLYMSIVNVYIYKLYMYYIHVQECHTHCLSDIQRVHQSV